MKRLILIGMLFLSACSGMEIGTKAWITRVDERQESQATHRKSIPLKCYFVNCDETKQGEGS